MLWTTWIFDLSGLISERFAIFGWLWRTKFSLKISTEADKKVFKIVVAFELILICNDHLKASFLYW